MPVIEIPDEILRQARAGAARAGGPVEDWIGLAVRTLVALQLGELPAGRMNPLARPLENKRPPADQEVTINLPPAIIELLKVRAARVLGDPEAWRSTASAAVQSFILHEPQDTDEDGPFSNQAAVDLLRPWYGPDGKLRAPETDGVRAVYGDEGATLTKDGDPDSPGAILP